MRQFSSLLGVALLGVVGCSNTLGITSPQQIEANLSGSWFSTADVEGGVRASTWSSVVRQ